MKKTRRLLSLALALMLALSLLAMPAAAAQDHGHDCEVCSAEEVQPREPIMQCPNCGRDATLQPGVDGKLHFVCRCGWSDAN